MKKIIKLNIFKLVIFVITLIGFVSPVFASGSATVGFNSNSTVSLGSNITVSLSISNISDSNGGVSSFEGNLVFDNEYLEYVSGTGTSSPYSFQINPSASYKMAGLDTSLSNGINKTTTIFTFVFKAKKSGTTQITVSNAKLNNNSERMNVTVNPKSITIEGGSTSVKNSDATLKSLSVDGYTLSPSFSANNTSYSIKVPSNVSSINLSAISNSDKAKIEGIGNVSLTGNVTNVVVKVTAEDGTVKSYNIKIEREGSTVKSSDATLKSLDVSGYTLIPGFKSNVNTYSIKVKNNITGLNVKAIANSDKASVSISGNKNWKEGNNTITIKVTAEDGSVNNYIVNVERESSESKKDDSKSSDNYLKELTIQSSHEIKPKFNKSVMSYNITVPYEVEKLNLNAITSEKNAKVEITGNEKFKVGELNVVEIKVTAEDGSVRIYSLNVTRSTTSSKTGLKNIEIKDVELSPLFNSNTLEYKAKVKGNKDKLDISATTIDSNSKFEIIGNENLKVGHNNILIKVTDEQGFSSYYSIDVEKEENKILGLSPLQFGIISGIIGFLLLLLLILLFKKKKDKEEKTPNMPVIEVKPEFNFGSKNVSDDDVIHGNYNQNSSLTGNEPKKLESKIYDADYEESIPYDPYDDIVTKREIVDAIHEATEKKDTSKLNMLLKQDELNRIKKELKEKEESENKNRTNGGN